MKHDDLADEFVEELWSWTRTLDLVHRRGRMAVAAIMRLFFFTFVAAPLPNTPAAREAGGAFVNCWIDAPSCEKAEAVARTQIREAGWRIDELKDARVVTRDDYGSGDGGLRYFEQAVIDREVLVFNRWPNEPQQDDSVH